MRRARIEGLDIDARTFETENVIPTEIDDLSDGTELKNQVTQNTLDIAQKQDTLTFDNTPTQNSTNPVTSGGVYSALSNKQDIIQYSTMPTASADNVGQIVQFIGTTGTYKNGFFYKCVLDNSVYSWEEVSYGVPSGGTTGQVLTKVDGTDYNTEWVTPSAQNAVTLDTTSQQFEGDKIAILKNAKTFRFRHAVHSYRYIEFKCGGTGDNMYIKIQQDDQNLTISQYDKIKRKINNIDYDLLFPTGKAGTFALTSDIPTAMTNAEIDAIMDTILV